jgi:hypothetical protein
LGNWLKEEVVEPISAAAAAAAGEEEMVTAQLLIFTLGPMERRLPSQWASAFFSFSESSLEAEEPIKIAAAAVGLEGEYREAVWLEMCAQGPMKRRLSTQSALAAGKYREEAEPIHAAAAVVLPEKVVAQLLTCALEPTERRLFVHLATATERQGAVEAAETPIKTADAAASPMAWEVA